jgi:hypothetical protein
MNTRQRKPIGWNVFIGLLTLTAALLTAPAASRAEVVYVSNNYSAIEKYDLATGADLGLLADVDSGLNYAYGMAFDAAGNLYAASSGNNSIMKFAPDGSMSVFATTAAIGPMALAFDRAGNLFGANLLASTIEKFTPDGVGSLFASTGLNHPRALAFDSAGNLYVSNEFTRKVMKFTPGGVSSVFADLGLTKSPEGLAFDKSGNLFVGVWNSGIGQSDQILKFTPGGVSSVFANTGANSCWDLAFDSAGNLYASFYQDQKIEKFTPEGVGSTFTSTAPNRPYNIAIQPIPEPSTFALTGLGTAALLIYRRRNYALLRCWHSRRV